MLAPRDAQSGPRCALVQRAMFECRGGRERGPRVSDSYGDATSASTKFPVAYFSNAGGRPRVAGSNPVLRSKFLVPGRHVEFRVLLIAAFRSWLGAAKIKIAFRFTQVRSWGKTYNWCQNWCHPRHKRKHPRHKWARALPKHGARDRIRTGIPFALARRASAHTRRSLIARGSPSRWQRETGGSRSGDLR